MKTNSHIGAFSWVLAWFLVAFFVAPAAAEEDLRLKRVMLSSGGVGYFEYETEVQGSGELSLKVRLDQVDDVLKSIVVYDDTGAVGAIGLPGREPFAEIFRDLPFGPEALESAVHLLNANQGAEITAVGARKLEGRIIGVVPERRELGDGRGTLTRHRVSLLTRAGVRQFLLEEADTVTFSDPALQAQVEEALAAVARHRVQDYRTLSIATRAEGRRRIRVAYVVAAPLWKMSYRLTLAESAASSGSGHLQGWAIIENTSGHAWKDVELTMVSGNPVTFRQALYESYYVDRPEVPVEVLGRILPRPDSGVLAELGEAEGKAEAMYEPMPPGAYDYDMDMMAATKMGAGGAGGMGAAYMAEAPAPPPRLAAVIPAESREATTQALFRVSEPVSVAAGHSLIVPVINRDFPAERVDLYQPATQAEHPLAAVRLHNDGTSGLPPGVLTIYERDAAGAVAYVGDAQLSALPVDEKRLVSFALDQKTKVDRRQEQEQRLAKGAISRGAFRRTLIDRQSTTYLVKGPAREARTVLLEHPRLEDWKLVSPAGEAVKLTADHYLIEVKLEAGGEKKVEVVMERPRHETIEIMSMSRPEIAAYAEAAELSQAVREAFARMAAMMAVIEEHKAKAGKMEDQRAAIAEDQGRIRNNMGRAPRESDLYGRYLKKLERQENQLEDLQEGIAAAEEARAQAEAELVAFVAKLEL